MSTHASVERRTRGYHSAAEEHHDVTRLRSFGFWIYILTDCFLFSILFANYVLFAGAYNGGPTGKDLFELDFVFIETMILLFSSITYGFVMIAAYRKNLRLVNIWLIVTFLLGASFIAMELYEFHHLISEGAGPSTSAFLSAFFVLVGTHGIHVTCGLIWMLIMFLQVNTAGITTLNRGRLSCLSLFWHFLDIVWIGVFTVVYLMGVL